MPPDARRLGRPRREPVATGVDDLAVGRVRGRAAVEPAPGPAELQVDALEAPVAPGRTLPVVAPDQESERRLGGAQVAPGPAEVDEPERNGVPDGLGDPDRDLRGDRRGPELAGRALDDVRQLDPRREVELPHRARAGLGEHDRARSAAHGREGPRPRSRRPRARWSSPAPPARSSSGASRRGSRPSGASPPAAKPTTSRTAPRMRRSRPFTECWL